MAEGKPGYFPRSFLLGAILAGLALIVGGTFLGLAWHDSPRGIIGSLLSRAIGGPFRLVDQNGKVFTDKDLAGKWTLIYFGFTHCADTCPAVLNNMATAFDALGAKNGDLRLVFITVDPRRDTPPVMKAYVAHFRAPITALTGTPEQIATAAKAYRVYYEKTPPSDADYDVNHSALIFVMDPKGKFAGSLTEEDTPAEIVSRLNDLIG